MTFHLSIGDVAGHPERYAEKQRLIAEISRETSIRAVTKHERREMARSLRDIGCGLREMAALLDVSHETIRTDLLGRCRPVEEIAAKRLGIPLSCLKAAAGTLWGRDFETERDARAGTADRRGHPRAGNRDQILGQATRAMMAEMQEYLAARKVMSGGE
jgi:lambda repressor-like predicted transcriptional regulator